jgi:hypothetical protein
MKYDRRLKKILKAAGKKHGPIDLGLSHAELERKARLILSHEIGEKAFSMSRPELISEVKRSMELI